MEYTLPNYFRVYDRTAVLEIILVLIAFLYSSQTEASITTLLHRLLYPAFPSCSILILTILLRHFIPLSFSNSHPCGKSRTKCALSQFYPGFKKQQTQADISTPQASSGYIRSLSTNPHSQNSLTTQFTISGYYIDYTNTLD